MTKQNYKIALLIFTDLASEAFKAHRTIERLIKDEGLGVLKDVQVLERSESTIGPLLEDYKNTNLGMIIFTARAADEFFPYQSLEEVGQRDEKFLVTLNLDEKLDQNFQKVIEKVKASKGKPYRGCDRSCR